MRTEQALRRSHDDSLEGLLLYHRLGGSLGVTCCDWLVVGGSGTWIHFLLQRRFFSCMIRVFDSIVIS